MTSHDPGVAAFVYQDERFAEVVAHDNGYTYGQLPLGHVYAGLWVRLDRPQRGCEWHERRLISEWLGGGAPVAPISQSTEAQS